MIVVLVLLVASLLLCLFLLAGILSLLGARRRQRGLARALAAGSGLPNRGGLDALDQWFRRTRPGRWVERQLVLAGEEHRRPIVVAGVATVGGIAVGWVLAVGLAPVFGLVGLAAIVLGVRWYLARGREKRKEQFVAQMPELARVLSNATSAGLSIAGAVSIAGNELAAPAGTEMQNVASRMRFGASLEDAIGDLEDRLASREVSVLASTLLVSARSGGSLVTALRDIADTLDERKEVRREIRTTLAQSTATGYMVIILGFGMLFLLNLIQPGTVEAMVGSWAGRAALIVSATLFVGGFVLIQRMTRFDG